MTDSSTLNRDPVLDRSLSLQARGLYQIMARHWSTDPEGLCRVLQATLAEEAGISQRQLLRYLGELVAGRYIVVQHAPVRGRYYAPIRGY